VVRQFTSRGRVVRLIAAVVVAAAVAGVAFQTLVRADSRGQPTPPVLAARAIAYLPSHASALTAHDLAADAAVNSLPATLARLGFVVGGQRTFQGPSKAHLQLVISRSLRFSSAAGARGFVRFVGQYAGQYVGEVPTVTPLTSKGRSGELIVEPLCACHMAQPALLAVVSSGPVVTWLEINGPGATPKLLQSLLRQAP
jgi:hypothetical protein